MGYKQFSDWHERVPWTGSHLNRSIFQCCWNRASRGCQLVRCFTKFFPTIVHVFSSYYGREGAICLTVCTSVLPTCLAAGGSRVGIIANEYLAKRLTLLRTYTTYCTHIHIKYSCFKNSEVNRYCKYQFSSLIEPWCSEMHIFTA